MANAIFEGLRLYQDVYNDDGYASVDHLSKGMATASDVLSPIVTNLFYSNAMYGSKNFPLTFMTEGQKKVNKIKSTDLMYRTKILGKPKKTSTVATNLYSVSDQPGKNATEFIIQFKDRWFSKNQVLTTGDRAVQVQVLRDPVKKGDVYEYSVKLFTHDKAKYCPVSYLGAGVKWAGGIHKVGIHSSTGVEHRSQAPGEMFNQLSMVRNTYQFKGNVQNKIMVFELKLDGKVMKYWCEWELFQHALSWKEKCEDDLWNSKLNRTDTGEILNRDEDSDAIIPSGAGAIQQIPNHDTYSILTAEKIEQVVGDALYNASDSTKRRVDVYTGMGGKREASNAMTAAAQALGLETATGKFVEGSDHNLVYGAYFTKFRHIDGHEVNFIHLPMLDIGAVAQAAEKHPISGWPLTSYSMYFIDMSTYDGESNVQYVVEEGREDIEFVVPGAMVPKGYGDTRFRATSKDASSIEWIKTQGVCIKKPTNCFELTCNLS